MDSPASSVSQGDSPREVSTTDKRDIRCAGSIKQESLCQRRLGCKSAKHHRHMPYDRSPGGSTCTSSDESTSETDPHDVPTTEVRKVKRVAANSRERKRMHTVNSAFDQLRELVPTYPSNRKLSKIDTLRLACSYIEDLTGLLNNPAVIHGDDVKLYHPPEGFVHGGTTAVYPGMEVKSEYPEFSGCNYQHYRVHPNVYFSDCASSDYSASESETQSPPYLTQNCQPGIGVRPRAFTRTSSDSAVATQMALANIGTNGHVYHQTIPLPPNCSPLATVQHTSPSLLISDSPPPPIWQRSGSLPYCLYGQ